MKTLTFAGIYMLLCVYSAFGQAPAFSITDKQPTLVDGLELGYTIKSTEVKAVGDKGNFSRYSVSFYVRNTTNLGKIMLYKQGWNIANNVSNQLAKFNCLNATGARLTSKEAIINAEACNVLAMVPDCDPKKTNKNKQFVQIGYWIKPGETIATTAILITPLNELPNVQVIYMAAQLTPLSDAVIDGPQLVETPGPTDNGTYIKLKNNFYSDKYINNQQGPPQSTTITQNWWSAQWQVIRDNGHLVRIKSRWKGTFLGVDQRGYVTLSDDFNNRANLWAMETTNDQNVFRFKSLMTAGYLSIATTGVLIQTKQPDNNFVSGWSMEQP